MKKCCACSKEFRAGDKILTFSINEVRYGEKSGALGIYPNKDYGEDHQDYSHFTYQCLERTFSPIENPFLYDILYNAIKEEAYKDAKDEAYEEFQMDVPPSYDNDDPPECIWCKKIGITWMLIRTTNTIFYCPECNQYWDQDENPVAEEAA